MAIFSINGGAGFPVAGAIPDAARSIGTSFEYLLTTAQIESNLNPAAQATTSSAKGLYQFIDQTWLVEAAREEARMSCEDLVANEPMPPLARPAAEARLVA